MRPRTVPGPVATVDLQQVFRDLPQPVAGVTGLSPSGKPVGMTVSSLTSGAGLRTLPADDGIPLLGDALTVFLCDVREEYPAGDHPVVLGQVRAVDALLHGTGLDTVSLQEKSTPRRDHGARLMPCA